jgi:hypothetical protein
MMEMIVTFVVEHPDEERLNQFETRLNMQCEALAHELGIEITDSVGRIDRGVIF